MTASSFCFTLTMLVCISFRCGLSAPLEGNVEGIPSSSDSVRVARSPKLLHHLLGGGHHGHGGGNYGGNHGGYGGNHGGYGDHQGGSGSFASSGAFSSGHGHSQSQSASFSFGPFTASFSQSQAGGKGGGYGDPGFFDY